MSLINPNFEDGDTGWSKGALWSITTGGLVRDGQWSARWDGGNGANSEIVNDARAPVSLGENVTAQLYASTNGAGGSQGGVHIMLVWYDAGGTRIGETVGNIVTSTGTSFATSSVSDRAPSGAAFVSVGARAYRNSNPRPYFIDSVSWNYVRDRAITITSPTPNQTFTVGEQVPLRVSITGTRPAVTSVSYLVDSIDTYTSATAPYGVNVSNLTAGSHTVVATANLADGTTISTPSVIFLMEEVPAPPILREYKASNAYGYLVAENFSGLTSSMPPNAIVVGAEVLIDYKLDVLVRAKDKDVPDITQARYEAVFDAVNSGTIEAVLMAKNGAEYQILGSPMTAEVPLTLQDYSVTEDAKSEGKRWTVLETGEDEVAQVTVGDEDLLFSLDQEFAYIFREHAIGVRFVPNVGTMPSYAAAGDAVFRLEVHSLKLRVYFDAGSVEYYFASPDKTEVIKGILVSSEVFSGDFRTGDATGILQLKPELEVVDGSRQWIGNDWTIHAAYPPSDANQVGFVDIIEGSAPYGMEYNKLPNQKQVKDNRSRYQFITENFYGDPNLNSMYGVHGLPRAFAYNGDYFYKIYTQPDAEKDMPRSVANHHGHLALGYHGGRVDISVVGEPYNFDGAQGASSWAFGDKVVGLLPLSGTILGVFGAKSIWGISGTTVDNFATQVISPNIGATEYTITDMGFPVYANAYGIYTLSQTQQYGDYLGQPMSQSISPWLRPRLLRKPTSDKEVVCAWPVRSKNQYRLAFSDGYVTSMTLNGQQVPTFSFQKYFYTPSDPPTTMEWVVVDDFTDSVGGEQ